MSKALFRWLRGELNGYYINNINQSWNEYTSYIRNFFGERSSMQFEHDKIDNKDLQGLGKFAGIFLPRITVTESKTSLRMTEGHLDNNEQISESGLYSLEDENFDFSKRDVKEDINDNATDELRSSLVGTESVVGYISSEETDVLDEDGKVKPSAISPTPPSDPSDPNNIIAYTEFYGNQFLFLSEAEVTFETPEKKLFIELFKAMQYIRYNGESLQSLCRLISILCPDGLVKINHIQTVANKFYMFYTFDDEVDIDHKQQRLSLLLYIISIKFPQIIASEE